MAEQTKIEWADFTLNIWFGCTKITPACDWCYAEAWAKRSGLVKWGDHPRVEAKHWRAKLAEIAKQTATWPRHPFVFVNSLSDFADNQADLKLQADALLEFAKHPDIIFLVLTKRPQNLVKLARAIYGPEVDLDDLWPKNVAIGCTIEDRKRLEINGPALKDAIYTLGPAFGFWSCEPLLEDIGDVAQFMTGPGAIRWLITGGESGPHARPTHPDWERDLRDQAADHGIAYLHKQNGEWAPGECSSVVQTRTQRVADWNGDGWLYSEITPGSAALLTADDEPTVWRLGKKDAGRTLDGVTHDARPKVRA